MSVVEVGQVLSAVVVGLCAGLIGVALARLPESSIRPSLHAFVASGVAWGVGDLIATSATDMLWKQAGLLLLYAGAIAMPTLWWMVALRWADEERAGLPLRSAAWQRIPQAFVVVMWLAMITNPWHGEFLTPVIGGRNLYQPLWYAMAIPNYLLILGAFAVELDVARRVARPDVRRQAALLISASLVTLLGNALYVSNLVAFDMMPLVLSVSGALLLVGMAREGLFGVLPVALPVIAEQHPDGLVVVGPDGHVRFANARSDALLAPVCLSPGGRFVDVLQHEKLRPASPSLGSTLATEPCALLGQAEGMLFRVEAESPRWLQLAASPLHGRGGKALGYCVRITDLTAQKEAELHARQTRRLDSVADLARTLSGEFQGAFALVQANADLMRDDPASGRPFDRRLTRIMEAARYGSELAQQLQLYTGSVSTSRVLLELSEVVEESCDLIECDLPQSVSLLFAPCEQLLPVHVDAIQLRHCIYNLLTNAIESMGQRSGEIHVSTGVGFIDPARMELVWGVDESAADFAFVRIADEAGGMDSETEERAFEPFFSTRGKDRGNGLSTVLGIARAHGALVEMQNDEGRGCAFTLYFPLERAIEEA